MPMQREALQHMSEKQQQHGLPGAVGHSASVSAEPEVDDPSIRYYNVRRRPADEDAVRLAGPLLSDDDSDMPMQKGRRLQGGT
jgi:hypothetical protein